MRGKTGVAVGALMSLLTICKGLPLSYNRDLQEATPNIWRSVETVRASVRVMEGMVRTMKIHSEVLAAQSITGFTTATELADTFVRGNRHSLQDCPSDSRDAGKGRRKTHNGKD